METQRIFNKHPKSESSEGARYRNNNNKILQNSQGEFLVRIKHPETNQRGDLTTNQVQPSTVLGQQTQLSRVRGQTYLQSVDNQAEIVRAAKSLFSKKTRTLYHWMYPNTPKFQLKSAVSLAWDTMGLQEKQFYISQVLGKFGYLQSSLMVNPQLGCMSLPTLPPLNLQQPDLTNVETNNAVSNLLQDVNTYWPQMQACSSAMGAKKRGRPRGSKRLQQQHAAERYSRKLQKHSSRAPDDADFNDDPELRKELEQFQWTLHLVDK